MNKVLVGIAIGLFLGFLSYSTLTYFSSSEVVTSDFARVTIKNESGRNAKKVLLTHERGTFEANGLMDKEEVRFIFKNRTENTYKIIVTFENDLTLASNEVYFEHGYRGTEMITDSKIITENN